jgi:lipopolysaccharide/colanic/teichoic acid biosynthesis glycosyltransferase
MRLVDRAEKAGAEMPPCAPSTADSNEVRGNRAKDLYRLLAMWVAGDALAIAAALYFAYEVRYNLDWLPLIERLEPITSRYALVMPAAVLLWLVLFAFNRLYDSRYLLTGLQEYGKVIVACSLGILVLIVLSFVEPNLSVSRSWLVLSWFLSIVFVSAERFAVRRVVRWGRARGRWLTRAIIVGANEHAKAIARQLSPATESGIQIIGFVDDYLPCDSFVVDQLRVLDRPSALARVARETGATEAIVVQGAIAWESFMEIITQSVSALDGLEIKLSPGFYEIMATGVRLTQDGFVPLLALEKSRITGVDAVLKRLLDVSVSLSVVILTSPLLGLLILLVKSVSPGPAFQTYPVLGVREKQFTTWKFRTRQPKKGSDESEDHALAHLLYRSGADKLPQFVSVLRGEMSLVGPRPVPAERAQVYQEWLPTLSSVKPGITGPWVVSGAAIDSLEAEIRLDLFYIRNWTIWLDLQLILQTMLRLFHGERPVTKR